MNSWVLNLDRSQRILRASFFFTLPLLSIAATSLSPVYEDNRLLWANNALIVILGVVCLLSRSQPIQKAISLVTLGPIAICMYFVALKGIYPLLYLPLITLALIILFDSSFGLGVALLNVLLFAGAYILEPEHQHDQHALRVLIASALLAPLAHTLLYSRLELDKRRYQALVDLCLHGCLAMSAVIMLTGFTSTKLFSLLLAIALYAALKFRSFGPNRWYPLLGCALLVPIYAYAHEESGLPPAMFFPIVSMLVYLSAPRLEALITSIALLSVTIFYQLSSSQDMDGALMTRFVLNSLATLVIFHALFVVGQPDNKDRTFLSWRAKSLIYVAIGVGVGLLLRVAHHDFTAPDFSTESDIRISLINLWVWLLFTVVGSQLWIHLIISREVQAQLQASKAQNMKLLASLEAATEAAGLGMLERSETGEYIANTKLREIFGFSPDTKINYKALMLPVHPDDIARVNEFVKSDSSLESNTVIHRILVNNETKWVQAFSSHRTTEQGQYTTNIAILDITAEKVREAELEMQRDLADRSLSQEESIRFVLDSATAAAKIAIFEIECETRLIHTLSGEPVNPGLFQGDKTIDEAFGLIFGPEYLDQLNQLIETADGTLIVAGKSVQTGEFSHWAKLSVSSPYIRNGRFHQAVSWVVVTELEQARRDAEAAKLELERRREKQAQMFSIIGHELRTPIASIKMMQDELQLATIEPYGATICDTTQLVLELLDDLKIVTQPAQIQTKSKQLDNPLHVVESTVNSLSSWLNPHNFVVKLSANKASETPALFATAALRQITSNLVKNAALHSEGSAIWVDIETETTETELLLSVKYEDDGHGISADEQAQVFEAFERGQSHSEGTGLGLFIVKELATLMNGDVSYFDSAHGGAGFALNCRLERAPQPDITDQDAPKASITERILQGRRVLFAEDQLTLQLLTKSLLEKAGAETCVANDGQQALEAYDLEKFDLVITDAMMPKMNGYQLSAALRAKGYGGPIIAVTAAVIGEEIDNLKTAGVDLVLPKPLNMQLLKQKLADYWFRSDDS